MTSLPPALLAVNEMDQDGYAFSQLISQLYIDQIWSQEEFNDIIIANPSYPDIIHLNNLRILVMLSTWDQTETDHSLFDAVLFYPNNGLIEVEKNKFGPPGQTYLLDHITIWSLLRAANSPYVASIPNACQDDSYCENCECDHKSCCCDNFPFGGQRGIFKINQRTHDPSGVHSLNCDTEPFNKKFKARKS